MCAKYFNGKGEILLTICSEEIYQKANKIVHKCGTRDALQIAQELGIYLHFVPDFKNLLGMYTYQQRERHILLNANMDDILTRMVCAHELGHDTLHRDKAKGKNVLSEFILFDMRTAMEYEANAFAAHIMIDDEELAFYLHQGHDVAQLSAAMNTNINLMLIKLNEMNRMGRDFNLPYVPRADFFKNIKPEN